MINKNLLTLLFFLSLFFSANATHNTGGEITVEQTDYLNYKATIHTYTFASSLPADRDSLNICWGDGMCEWIVRDSFSLIGKDKKHNIYSGEHSYAQEGNYIISMTDPNRNGQILNVNFPSSDNVPFHIETSILVSTLFNNTPVLLNPPLDCGFTGITFQHNSAAVDWDGDSLAYEMVTPMQAVSTLVPNYLSPSQVLPNSISSENIDAELGTYTWETPQMEGTYVVAIKITEYRDGQILSTVIRDFQFEILEEESLKPLLSNPTSEVTAEVGETVSFSLTGDNAEVGEVLIQELGLPFLVDDTAVFSAPNDFMNAPVSAEFSWTTTPDHVLLSPYYVVVRAEAKDINAQGATVYEVVKITLNDSPTSTNSPLKKLDLEVFPNPISEGVIFIKNNGMTVGEKMEVRILDLDGKVLLQKIMIAQEGLQKVDCQNLKTGNYFLHLRSEGKHRAIQISVK